ncbi:unnamed protein product [Spirodela intermedia]|uniref:C3H1-type domain-containing protein n=1 Tax=Spirodela intermedia TaxID=51605 RepID=A0A7I8JK38_SPIIN|nr:unnamed protein product [Spirodela intermedia]CAA6670546.1 unnamed protein product [Spirodela intermedia]
MLDDGRSQNPGNAVAPSFTASSKNLEESMWRLNIKDNQGEQDTNVNPYPDRPDEPNCSYYMRTGQCGYGNNCRFNHPAPVGKGTHYRGRLPEREGQPDCQFFLKTGTCKYGITCKYHHPRDRLVALHVPLNMLGLPMRQEEKSCPYYMRNGSCKFGFACKFHHPEPTMGAVFHDAAPSVYESSGSAMASQSVSPFVGRISSWTQLPQSPYVTTPNLHGLPSFLPVIISPSHNVVPTQPAWNTYAGAVNPGDVPGQDHLPNSNPQMQLSSIPQAVLPERPDQPECQYFLKTGRCKYGPACKYHHPREKIPSSNPGPIGPHMLPLRPLPRITHLGSSCLSFLWFCYEGSGRVHVYRTYGSCKYGAACKFDHPYAWPGYYGYTAYHPPFSTWSPSSLIPFERSSPMNRTSSGTTAPEAFKVADEFQIRG